MVCLIIWVMNIVVFTPHDEHSQGEHPHEAYRRLFNFGAGFSYDCLCSSTFILVESKA